jgi:hypothetical protein
MLESGSGSGNSQTSTGTSESVTTTTITATTTTGDAGTDDAAATYSVRVGGLAGQLEGLDLYIRADGHGLPCAAGSVSKNGVEPGCSKCLVGSYVVDGSTRCALCMVFVFLEMILHSWKMPSILTHVAA